MSATYTEARDAMLELLRVAWAAHPMPANRLLWDDRAANPPKGAEPWARVIIRHNLGEQETLSSPIGQRLFKREGLITVSLFTPIGDGLKISDALAKTVTDAYEGKKTSNGVWFRKVRLRENGVDGSWYVVDVLAEFHYNEVK